MDPLPALDRLVDFAGRHPRLFVLTGAGCSTASGIPDYRDEDGAWKTRPPVQHRDFVRSERVRRRYWARAFSGWSRMADAQSNAAHRALAELETAGRVELLVTQNVDRLHQRAGSRKVLDLHGRLDRVVCLACDASVDRDVVQHWLALANPRWVQPEARSAPDGDAHVEADTDAFEIPACPACGGVLKPDVVFFGDSVPRERVDRAYQALTASDAVLVVGSSLMVFSGYRFVREAARTGTPVAIVNLGRTRADDVVDVKVEAPCAEVLPALLGRTH